MPDHDDDLPQPERTPIYRRYQEQRKIEALLECIEFSGVDLLDPDSKVAFTERLARGRLRDERWVRRGKLVSGAGKWAGAAIGGIIVSSYAPDLVAWFRRQW